MRELSNHEYDAVAGGYTFTKSLATGPSIGVKLSLPAGQTFGSLVPTAAVPAKPFVFSSADVSIKNGVATEATSGNASAQVDASTTTLPNGWQLSSASVNARTSA